MSRWPLSWGFAPRWYEPRRWRFDDRPRQRLCVSRRSSLCQAWPPLTVFQTVGVRGPVTRGPKARRHTSLRLPDPAAQEFLGPEFGLTPILQNFASIPTFYARKTRRGGSGKVQRFFRDVMGSEAGMGSGLRPSRVTGPGTPTVWNTVRGVHG